MSTSTNQPTASGHVPNWLRLAVLVPLARFRFLFILGAIGLVIVKWEYLSAWYDKLIVTHDAESHADTEYFCPMHPTVVRPTKKEKCPVCFMPLSKRKKSEPPDATIPAGTAKRVQLSPYRVLLAGVQTSPVEYLQLSKEITSIGTVEFDERQLKTVASRVKGRIDTLFVNQTGQLVKKRDPLASIFSPDLIVTIENLLDARKSNNPELERNAVQRLQRWGIDDEEIQQIVKDGKPVTHLTIRSPIDGHVIKKFPREGQYVEEGSVLYEVADISTVWVQARLYEDDLAFLPKDTHDPKTGLAGRKLKVTATARSFPGRDFEGTLSFVFPHLDQESRTLSVRFELDNQQHELRPGMSATVNLKLDAKAIGELPAGRGLQMKDGMVLAVPERSIIDTGSEQLVYLEEAPGSYLATHVKLGPRMLGPNQEVVFPVFTGLKADDRVVTGGSFLIDAETRLNRAAGSIYIGANSGGGGSSSTPIRPSTPPDESKSIQAAMKNLPPADRLLAEAQKTCPIQNRRLGSMGPIQKIELNGKPVFLCCSVCNKAAKEDPAGTLARIAMQKKSTNP